MGGFRSSQLLTYNFHKLWREIYFPIMFFQAEKRATSAGEKNRRLAETEGEALEARMQLRVEEQRAGTMRARAAELEARVAQLESELEESKRERREAAARLKKQEAEAEANSSSVAGELRAELRREKKRMEKEQVRNIQPISVQLTQ